eukprot:scaffold32795_cov35-Tisochrysis_lutea.AAC.4
MVLIRSPHAESLASLASCASLAQSRRGGGREGGREGWRAASASQRLRKRSNPCNPAASSQEGACSHDGDEQAHAPPDTQRVSRERSLRR